MERFSNIVNEKADAMNAKEPNSDRSKLTQREINEQKE